MSNVKLPDDTLNTGKPVATNTLTRDGVSEVLQLVNISDISGVTVSVSPPGTSGANALAIQGVNGGVAIPVAFAAWSYATVSVSGFTTIKGSAGVFGGIINLSTNTQTPTITIYDSASGSSANVLSTLGGMAAGTPYTPVPNGISTASGIVVNCSAAPTGAGLLILYR